MCIVIQDRGQVQFRILQIRFLTLKFKQHVYFVVIISLSIVFYIISKWFMR